MFSTAKTAWGQSDSDETPTRCDQAIDNISAFSFPVYPCVPIKLGEVMRYAKTTTTTATTKHVLRGIKLQMGSK